MSGTIEVARDGHLATATIANAAKRDAMTQAMRIAMGDVFHEVSEDAGRRCVVITGAGDTAFGRRRSWHLR